MTEEWYTPFDIVFDRDQMMWLCRNLYLLKAGVWPPNPEGSRAALLTQRTRKNQGGFETPCQYAAEVEVRLKCTKVEGKLLMAELNGSWQAIPYDYLQPESRTALNYITGWPRKWESYSVWKAKRKWRKKIKTYPF